MSTARKALPPVIRRDLVERRQWREELHHRDMHGQFSRTASRAAHVESSERKADGSVSHFAGLGGNAHRYVFTSQRGPFGPKRTGLVGEGVNTSYPVIDQHGDRWVFKQNDIAGSDQAEYAANTTARLWGYPTAEITHAEVDGGQGVAQRMFDDVAGDLITDNSPALLGHGQVVYQAHLDHDQLVYLSREHVLDYAIGNVDTHEGNVLVLGNGELRGIDKGISFEPEMMNLMSKDMPNIGSVYSGMFNRVSGGRLPEETVAAMREASLDAARHIQSQPDEPYREVLVGMFGDTPMGRRKAKAWVAHKNDVVKNVTRMWDRLMEDY